MKNDYFELTYEIEDGYAGGDRPHKVKINVWEMQECETQEELDELIDQYVREDMDMRIYPVFTYPSLEQFKKEETNDDEED